MKYLYESNSIRESINELFANSNEKWAVVGFVGYGALDQLPTGVVRLSVICWPKAGGTHPEGIRRLMKAGIKVYFCNNLHHKLYWSKGVGLIAGSANLSARALGDTGQHEFCVFCDDPKFDIASVLSGLVYSPVTKRTLDALQTAHDAMGLQGSDLDESQLHSRTFLQASKEELIRKWKVVCWDEPLEDESALRLAVEELTGQAKFANYNGIEEGVFERGDFVLQVHVDEDGAIVKGNFCNWLYVSVVINEQTEPYIVQLKKLREYPAPPFQIDSTFKKSFREVFTATDWGKVCTKTAVVRKSFIASLVACYEAND